MEVRTGIGFFLVAIPPGPHEGALDGALLVPGGVEAEVGGDGRVGDGGDGDEEAGGPDPPLLGAQAVPHKLDDLGRQTHQDGFLGAKVPAGKEREARFR